ncbi:MAG: FAD-dependent oxidoreductase [Ignavibacteriales bacterium]|nr:FAD-dependent oxidoreductase [Ignavibacteriales bacterium]
MQLLHEYDIIVAGAGIAGISAAIKAGNMGASVLLIEHYGFVGGMSTAGMVSPFMKHSINGVSLVEGVFQSIEKEMRKIGGMIDNGFYANSFRSAAFNLLSSANVTVLLHCEIEALKKNEREITEIHLFAEQNRFEIKGKVFIDTTGDAYLVYTGGFNWVKGDEKTGYLQALTLFFRMGGINLVKVAEYASANRHDFFNWMDYNFNFDKIISVAGFFSFVKRAINEGRLPKEIEYIFFTTLPESEEGSFNTSNVLGLDGSTSSDLTKAELIGRKQANDVVKLLQDEVPGFENSYLLETATQIGVRETRRAIGDYVVTGIDISSGSKFEDAIARGCYGIDIHGQKGENSRMEHLREGEYYEIPFRSLMVKDADNLLVAGRCISSTREGHSALRIMPTSSATGEAAGAAAALSVRKGTGLRQLIYSDLFRELSYNLKNL